MEKLKQPPFDGLNRAEQLRDIYRQAYLELEAGDRIKLSRFDNFKVDWRQVEEEETFDEFSSDYTKNLMAQTVEILATDILEK